MYYVTSSSSGALDLAADSSRACRSQGEPYLCIYIYIYMYTCVCICLHTYIHTYIHTY